MKLFVYEYLSCQPLDSPLPRSLRVEGAAMYQALVADLHALPELEVETMVASGSSLAFNCRCHVISPGEEEHRFKEVTAATRNVLVIAPEFDDILFERRNWVEQAGGRWLGCPLNLLEVMSDKLRFARYLAERRWQALTPETILLDNAYGELFVEEGPLVCKPRYGAGSQATVLVRYPEAWSTCLETIHQEGWRGELIIQPYIAGVAASVLALVGKTQAVILPPCTQELSPDGRFHYLGGTVPLDPPLLTRAVELTRRLLPLVSEARGFVGIDIVLGQTAEGEPRDVVIEMNPRLTTSYLGLRALARTNLAAVWLAVLTEKPLPPLLWRQGKLRFHPDGRIEPLALEG